MKEEILISGPIFHWIWGHFRDFLGVVFFSVEAPQRPENTKEPTQKNHSNGLVFLASFCC